MPPKDKYTDPKLREEVKEEIQQGDKGGAPGQWSARKAQMMASEYKKRGGDYNTDKSEKDESQKNLTKWGSEEWQTKEGSGNAKREDGSEKRYLPKKAWEKMSEEEKQATEDAKREGDEEGKQHVGNTQTAKEKRKEAGEEVEAEDNGKKEEKDSGEKDGEEEKTGEKSGKTDKKSSPSSAKKEKPKAEPTRRSTRNKDKQEQDDSTETKKQSTSAGEKRKDTSSSSTPSAKKQKTNSEESTGKAASSSANKSSDESTSHAVDGKSTYGSKHDSPSAPHPPASADRLPKPGQKVTWKAMPGWVEGSVIEVVTSDKTVEGGKHVKASEKDPRIVLRSHGPSGKVAVHKPEAVFFE